MSPPADTDLKSASEHFGFGKNWAEYARLIDQSKIAEAQRGLARLLGDEPLAGKSFLDIGCGSGIHALAAIRMGAARVLGVDLDRDSVATTRAVLSAHAGEGGPPWDCQEVSVFDLDPQRHGQFDVVYSRGVLHHTGAMHEAITKAAAMVAPGGTFIIALYRKTRLCGFWKREKRFYTRASPGVQALLRWFYITAFRLRCVRWKTTLREYVKNYQGSRGMDFYHDVHDWMGGYPYESISPPEVEEFVGGLGFDLVRSFTLRYSMGYFGSGCDEYVFRRRP